MAPDAKKTSPHYKDHQIEQRLMEQFKKEKKMMMMTSQKWSALGSALASLMFIWAVVRQYFPSHLDTYLSKQTRRILSLFYPYIDITIPEYTGERMNRSDAYTAAEAYLTANCTRRATRLKAEMGKDSSSPLLTMDDYEEVTDEFRGASIWWSSSKTTPHSQVISFYPTPEERRSYRLTFHRRHRDLIISSYLAHVMKEGKEIGVRNRQRKLFTNNGNTRGYGKIWIHVVFEHPASFATLAMDPNKKRELIADLDAFKRGKEYYARIGKAWKRGYLLYGPPGTGKSTMIAAMANYLDYDIYDLELTTVKSNTELRQLMIQITGKSIVVIEDIDCSLDLTGERKKKKEKEKQGLGEGPPAPPGEGEERSKVTLSGLLNFIDGLWSACDGERVIVFTTNHVEKLDPALIRRGRMDKHIEMGYCTPAAFRVLAKNYLGIDSHPMFEEICRAIEETKMTPADVAEHLTPKSVDEDPEVCLRSLVEGLKKAKEEGEAKEAAAAKEAKEEAEKKQPKEEDDHKERGEEENGTGTPEVVDG